jgi:hypothetical protein
MEAAGNLKPGARISIVYDAHAELQKFDKCHAKLGRMRFGVLDLLEGAIARLMNSTALKRWPAGGEA